MIMLFFYEFVYLLMLSMCIANKGYAYLSRDFGKWTNVRKKRYHRLWNEYFGCIKKAVYVNQIMFYI